MLYLIDANSIIDAKDKYYVIGRVPEYWDWLLHHGNAGHLKVRSKYSKKLAQGRIKTIHSMLGARTVRPQL
jgi:hypothetical protein